MHAPNGNVTQVTLEPPDAVMGEVAQDPTSAIKLSRSIVEQPMPDEWRNPTLLTPDPRMV